MASPQPSGMVNDNGVILTVGINASGEQGAIVLPVCTDTTMDPDNLCTVALDDFVAVGAVLPQILACISTDAYVRFVQAEGMVDGKVPARLDYAPSTKPGTLDSNTVPNQVAALVTFYEDPADAVPGDRMITAKTFLPGISTAHIVEGLLDSTIIGVLVTLTATLINGWTNASSGKWYRVLSTPFTPGDPTADPPIPSSRPGGVDVKRISRGAPRGYTGTQRRRLLPH